MDKDHVGGEGGRGRPMDLPAGRSDRAAGRADKRLVIGAPFVCTSGVTILPREARRARREIRVDPC